MVGQAYKRYLLGMLTLVCTMNYVDRGLMVLLLQSIKEDLHLSDTQLGFLTGIAFGLFYATLGLPIARWADRGNRSTITSLAIGLWGLTVMVSVFVTNFYQLVAARIAAAVGESGAMPPTYSLVGDYFSKAAERARAMSVYWLASPFASIISFIAGGWLNERYGWRATFLIMGIPALLIAVIVKLTVVEPRTRTPVALSTERRLPHMMEVLGMLWNQRSCRHLSIAIVLVFTMGQGLNPWYAAFMIRSHGMNTAELGVWLGAVFGLSGIIGILFGGYVAGRWFADDESRQLRLNALMTASLVPCFVMFLLLPHKYYALGALSPMIILFNFFLGPTFALMQRLVMDEMRATTMAVVMLLANLIGMGVGPQVVGILSDALLPMFGSDSLRYAMLTTSLLALWAAYHFWYAARMVQDDLSAVAQYTNCIPAGTRA
jgi:MFS family permease